MQDAAALKSLMLSAMHTDAKHNFSFAYSGIDESDALRYETICVQLYGSCISV